ncbi:hypothetical protein [Pantoea anthophila]|uniref:hypothetical protein n=1 Tax=Pantoea anthophila TaxID=470931 RepID=UPI00128BB03D
MHNTFCNNSNQDKIRVIFARVFSAKATGCYLRLFLFLHHLTVHFNYVLMCGRTAVIHALMCLNRQLMFIHGGRRGFFVYAAGHVHGGWLSLSG